MPGIPKFGGGYDQSMVHPVVLVALVLSTILIFAGRRKHTIIPMLFMAILVPPAQQFYFAGIHLYIVRLVILLGLIRTLGSRGSSGSRLGGGWNRVDTFFVLCMVIQAVATLLQYPQIDALSNQIGFLWDDVGGYLLLRSLIQNEADVYRAIKCLSTIVLIVAIGMVIEQVKLLNVFGLMGSMRTVPDIREGKIRSQGPFVVSITAGTVGAMLLPLFFLLWKRGKDKVVSVIGIVGATIMTFTANSSTCLMAYAGGLLALCVWPLRKKMRLVRWGIVFGLIVLQLAMKAPVWFVIAHVDLVGGSSSFHRAVIIDNFIRNFGSWWLVGTKEYVNWGLDMWDVQNQYVSVGETGGLAAFICFLALISKSFGNIGRARRVASSERMQWFFWILGASLFANVVGFFGANYFDQSHVLWFALLAMISGCTSSELAARRSSEIELQRITPEFCEISPSALSADKFRHEPTSFVNT